jgi:hypothetical protein
VNKEQLWEMFLFIRFISVVWLPNFMSALGANLSPRLALDARQHALQTATRATRLMFIPCGLRMLGLTADTTSRSSSPPPGQGQLKDKVTRTLQHSELSFGRTKCFHLQIRGISPNGVIGLFLERRDSPQFRKTKMLPSSGTKS